MQRLRSQWWIGCLAVVMLAIGGCDDSGGGSATKPTPKGGPASGGDDEKITIAFVTNNASPFWMIAKAGIRTAEKEFGVTCEVKLPSEGTAADQQQIVEGLLARGISGLAISPNDAELQTDLINDAAKQMNVVTMDSDAPKSNRLCYVGTDNFKAGQVAGNLIKEALPEGGKIMIFVGKMDAQNAIDRSNGIKDVIKGTNIELLDIKTDQTDRPRAKQNVEETLITHKDVACLVGLWSYNGPQIIAAVEEAGKLGKVKMVLFDEEDATLNGVMKGHVHAAIVQQPFEFGRQSVKVLAALAKGDKTAIPENKTIEIPVKVIKQDNVKEFWDDLKEKVAAGKE